MNNLTYPTKQVVQMYNCNTISVAAVIIHHPLAAYILSCFMMYPQHQRQELPTSMLMSQAMIRGTFHLDTIAWQPTWNASSSIGVNSKGRADLTCGCTSAV